MADPITIVSNLASACTITLSDPNLAIMWVKALVGAIKPEDYMIVFKVLNPGDVDAVANAQQLVDLCIGQGV